MSQFSNSEDWLTLLLYGLDILLAPRPHKILQSFEWWDYQKRLKPQLRSLERAKLLQQRGTGKDRTFHLTAHGQLRACGGVDPVQRWQVPWDGKWRILIFDLPVQSASLRVKLWRWLRSERFGFLQQSVWISP